MSCAIVTPEQKRADDNLKKLKAMFNGVTIRDIDSKSRAVGKSITDAYGDTTTKFGEKMFEEIVWKATYKPADASFVNFTDGDFRRITSEIEKEAKRLDNPRLNVMERIGFVKRGVMGKFATTRWMNKHINLATNYERTKFSMYMSSNIAIAKNIRAEALRRNPELYEKLRPGVKSVSDLEVLERKLIKELTIASKLTGQAKHDKLKETQNIRDDIAEVFMTDGGQVLREVVEWLETTPNADGKRFRKAQLKKVDKFGKVIPEVLEGQAFARNVEKAGMDARTLLDNMGDVLINGLEQHKKAVQASFYNLPSRRMNSYLESIKSHIDSIKEGKKNGNYFPHYITEGLTSIEKIMDKIDFSDSMEKKNEYLGDLENSFSLIRQSIGALPSAARDRSKFRYDNWVENPLTVLRKYSMDAITFNRTNYLKNIYLQGMKHLPKEGNTARGLNNYLNDIFTLASRGYQDRPVWVNKTIRALTGYEFLSKIGFGVATAARNTMSGMYYIQSVGNRAFFNYLRDWNKEGKEHSKIRDIMKEIESEQGFRFEDLSNPLFTEGLLPTQGLKVSDVDIIIDPQTREPSLQYKTDRGWQTFDSILTKATGYGAIFQKVTENFLRKHMFRFSFKNKYNELVDGGLSGVESQNKAKVYALDMVNKYAFEYSPAQKAPIVGGTAKNLGAFGQVAFQFMHYPMSFLQLQSEILRNSKDAVIARQWNSPDLYIPTKFAGLYLFTQLMSGVGNVDFNRLMENDTVDRIKDLKDALGGKKDIKGRGYLGPAVGDLFFLATLNDFIKLPDNQLTDLVVGYNNAYKLTDEQKGMRLLSTFNVEMSKIPRNWKALQNGTVWNVMMHELGLYPKGWTRDMRQEFPLKALPWEKGKTITGQQKAIAQAKLKEDVEFRRRAELQKLYRAMEGV